MNLKEFKKQLRHFNGNNDNTIFVELPDGCVSVPVQGIEMKATAEGNMHLHIITATQPMETAAAERPRLQLLQK